MFEPHMQPLIRTKLADCLQLVLSQRLIPLKKGEGRILALEKLINSYRVKTFIKDSTTNRIRSQMQAGTKEFESIDVAIAKLYQKGLITFNDGLTYVEDEQFYRELTGVDEIKGYITRCMVGSPAEKNHWKWYSSGAVNLFLILFFLFSNSFR